MFLDAVLVNQRAGTEGGELECQHAEDVEYDVVDIFEYVLQLF